MNGPKCHKLHIGKMSKFCPGLKAHNEEISSISSERYVGDVVSDNGRHTANIKARRCKGIGVVTGGMAHECTLFHKKIAQLISEKSKEEYSHVMNHLRTRLRFTLLKSTLIAIRGERGKSRKPESSLSELSFNTVPEVPSYEV